MALRQDGAEECFQGGLVGDGTTATASRRWLALYSSAGSDGTELTGNGYSRQQINGNAWTVSTTQPTCSNTNAVTWSSATADWTAIASVRLMDAATGGRQLVRANLSSPVSIAQDSQARISAGQFVMSFTVV